jgi:hypothetical protein
MVCEPIHFFSLSYDKSEFRERRFFHDVSAKSYYGNDDGLDVANDYSTAEREINDNAYLPLQLLPDLQSYVACDDYEL